MINFKRFFITIIALCSANFAFADSYIMISDYDISEIKCSDESVVSVKALTTLSNERKSIIVSSIKDGQTEFTIKVKNKIHTYKVDINNNKMTISGDKSTKILPIDLPPEALPTTEECSK